MKTTSIIICAVALTASAFTFVVSSDWKVKDDTYTIKFDAKNAAGSISGLKGTIDFNQQKVEASKFDVTVDVNTLNMGNSMKTTHAKAEDFFNVEKYPTIHFKSTSVEKAAAGYVAKGKLTIKETTKDISIPFTFDETGSEAMMKGNFEINRTEYGLQRNGVGEEIKIELNLPLKK